MTKVKVLHTIAGIDYGKADVGDLMMWPDHDAETLAEKDMVKIISKERGNNMIKPYIIGRENYKSPITHTITTMKDDSYWIQ